MRRTTDFIDSLGVVVHPSVPPYSLRTSDQLINDVKYIGVKYVRTNALSNAESAALIKKFSANGIRTNFTVPSPNNNPFDLYDDWTDGGLDFIRDYNLAGLTDSVENFNELDNENEGNYPDTFQDILKLSVPYLWNHSSDLRARNVKILSPALVGRKLDYNAVFPNGYAKYCKLQHRSSWRGRGKYGRKTQILRLLHIEKQADDDYRIQLCAQVDGRPDLSHSIHIHAPWTTRNV